VKINNIIKRTENKRTLPLFLTLELMAGLLKNVDVS